MKKFLFFLCFGLLFCFSCAQAVDNDLLYREQRSDKAFQELEGEFHPPKKGAPTSKPSFTTGKVLLKACAYGVTQKEARISALKALSQQIIAQVQAEERLSKKREGGKISRSYVSYSTIVSKSLLKGVKFEDLGREAEGYKVCVYFTDKSLQETLNYLKTSLNVDLKKLNRKQLKEALTKAQFMLNLAFLSTNEAEVTQFARAKIEAINTYLNYGCLVVNVIPDTAKIIINQREYASGEPIYLPPEVSYLLRITAPGYRTVTRRVYLAKGDKKSLSVELLKKTKAGIAVYVAANMPFLVEEARSLLTGAGFRVISMPLATNAFYIKMTDDKLQVGEYTKHVLSMYVAAYRGGEEFASVRGKIKAFFTTADTEKILIKKKAHRLLQALLKRLMNQLDVEKFRGEDEFDYRPLFGSRQIRKQTVAEANPAERRTPPTVKKVQSEAKPQGAHYQFSSIEDFAKFLVNSLVIKDVEYDILKPDASGEYYISIKTGQKYHEEVPDEHSNDYMIVVRFKIGYPKSLLRIAQRYLSSIAKKVSTDITAQETRNHNRTIFVGIKPILKNSALWNFGYTLCKTDYKNFTKSIDNERRKKVLELMFKDEYGITVLGLKYKYSYCESYWSSREGPICKFSLENNVGWEPSYVRFPWTNHFGRNNWFVLLDGWQPIILKGYVTRGIAEQIKSFSARVK